MVKKTIRVDEAAFEQAKAEKEANGQTWDEYLTDSNRSGPDTDDVVTELTAKLNVDTDDAQAEIQEVKDLIESLKAEVEGLESSMSVDASNISVSLDASERSKIAKEVTERLQ